MEHQLLDSTAGSDWTGVRRVEAASFGIGIGAAGSYLDKSRDFKVVCRASTFVPGWCKRPGPRDPGE
jgi:hypothetical protein